MLKALIPYLQAVIQAGIIGPLVQLLHNAEFEIKKEAAWAISNATSGGTPEQIKYVNLGFSLSRPVLVCMGSDYLLLLWLAGS